MANTVSILVTADGRGAMRELGRIQGSLGRMDSVGTRTGRRLGHALGTVARAGAYALAGGVVAAGYGMVKAIGSAADFEQQLNVLQAVSGATADQMKQISAESIRLGKDIHLPATSAQDAAVAMTELTKAGLSVRDAMAAARGTLQLAAAGEIDAATAATVSATALNQFGLAGSQAGHVADLLAGAANASAGEVSDFAEGLQYAGTAAHAAGQSIDLTVAALAEMANAGLQGSVAGSSLAQALRSLQAPTAKAQDAMDKYGISIYDAHGNMKPLDDVAGVFTKSLGDLTQKQQNATLAQIFGSRAVQAARVVFLGGKDALDKYADTVGKAGNAQRLAEARTKGFRGALAAFQSNIETLGITLGLVLIPAATAAARELSKVVDVISAIASAKSPRIAIQIAWRGVGRLFDSLNDLLFGGIDDATSKLAGAHRGVEIPVHYEGIVQKLTGAIKEGFDAVDWAAIGGRVADAFAAGLRFTDNQAQSLIASLVVGIDKNKAQIGTASAAVALEFVSALLDPGFWADNWATILAIAISIVPIEKFGAIGGKIGIALTERFGGALVRLLPDFALNAIFRVETLFRTGFRRIGNRILAELRGTATRFPTFFNRAFRAVEAFAVGAFRVVVSRVKSIFGSGAKAIEQDGVRAFRTINQRVLGIIGSVARFIAKVFLIRGAVNAVAGGFQALIDKIKEAISWVGNLASKIGSMPSLPSLPGLPHIPFTATGGITTRPQIRVVGEAGPEAIIPLSSGRGRQAIAGLGGGQQITMNFYGLDDVSLRQAAEKMKRLSARRA